jgi:hydrogenase maturation protease
MKLTVIGIGQTLRGDDAAGVEAVRRWQAAYPATASRKDVTVTLSELPGLALLDQLEGFDSAILVDAVQSSAEPGVIHRLTPHDLDAFGSGSGSAHGWGIAETLKLDRQLNPDSPNRNRGPTYGNGTPTQRSSGKDHAPGLPDNSGRRGSRLLDAGSTLSSRRFPLAEAHDKGRRSTRFGGFYCPVVYFCR